MSQCFHWKQVPPAEFAVIGSPVSHSLSPLMQNAALQALGINKRYVAIEVEPESFQEAMHQLVALGFEGINVTIPHNCILRHIFLRNMTLFILQACRLLGVSSGARIEVFLSRAGRI